MPKLGASEAEFPAAKTVRVNGNVRPCRKLVFQTLQIRHIPKSSPLQFFDA
jgi:hypothetical protein